MSDRPLRLAYSRTKRKHSKNSWDWPKPSSSSTTTSTISLPNTENPNHQTQAQIHLLTNRMQWLVIEHPYMAKVFIGLIEKMQAKDAEKARRIAAGLMGLLVSVASM
jgi:hypothetical protein